jgi:hypothetical protein
MRHCQTTLAILAALSASIALGDDFKTIDGKEYKNITVSRVEPDGIMLKSKSGISKVYFTELPKSVQERFHYDAAKGNAYSAKQNASLEGQTPTPKPTATATSTPTPSATATGIGLVYLAKSYASEPPINPDAIPGVTNSHVKGILWRETWERLDKNGQGQHDWAFLDACLNASDSHNKDAALQIVAGNFSPAWFFNLPGAKHIDTARRHLPTTVPWDPVFQAAWEEVQTAMANRYKGRIRLKYVVMAGVGHGSESFFATKPEERAQAEALAKSMGHPDAVTAWKAGVTWLIDMYARVWGAKPVVLCTGAPFEDGGTEALQAMFDYGDSTYRGQFGARADDLSANSPKDGQPSAEIIKTISKHCSATGYQFANHQNVNDANPPERLDLALKRGTGFGAHFIEVFADDADHPASAAVLDKWGIYMVTH